MNTTRTTRARHAKHQTLSPAKPSAAPRRDQRAFTFLTADDLYLFNEGSHLRLYEKLGAHAMPGESASSYCAVWAPNAQSVSVIGDFNGWTPGHNELGSRGDSGIWEGVVEGLGPNQRYKYRIVSRHNGYQVDKADPFGFCHQVPPDTASIVCALDYKWDDAQWMQRRCHFNGLEEPMAIYEVHLGSWRRRPEEDNRSLTYREIAPFLVDYVKTNGFTHVELLPAMEHPFYGSWGYQCTGYFAPSSRYGAPQDFMFLIDCLHQNSIGVILDWVPSHFPTDQHGLHFFDGTHLYEHADPRQGVHPDWNSAIFNYGRHEVRSYLLSSAFFWLDKYHVDGLRVDAVASMLYRDYSRRENEWVPNVHGGRENLEAITFLRRLNEEVYKHYPDAQTIAEESTAWPMVSRPTCIGGLGFGLKWDMGWMHDTLEYMARDPVFRKYHHQELTFRLLYAFTENFALPLSHDEVVHGKGSLLAKMPGDAWTKFANLRLLLGWMYAQPGKKLLFMGSEFGQWQEWQHDRGLDWHLLNEPAHAGVQKWVRDLNHFYQAETALHRMDFSPEGFEWIDCNDADHSVFSFIRKTQPRDAGIVVVCNFTPMTRTNYRVGVPAGGWWHERLNSDATIYGGGGAGNWGGLEASTESMHGRLFSLSLTLPPLSVLFFSQRRAAT